MSVGEYTQADRPLAIDTPLGKDVLLLTRFKGTEEISQLFEFELEMMSEKDNITARDIVGKNVTFFVNNHEDEPRYFNGFINQFSACGKGDRLSVYRATFVPWLWFLSRTSDFRVFQNKTIPDIVKEVLADLGFTDVDMSGLKAKHQEWDYCVQYRETDLHFISRLMEQEGIFYYFKHENGKHTMMLGDGRGAYLEAADKEVEYRGTLSGAQKFDFIRKWEHKFEFRTGRWAQIDYNFEMPTTNLMSTTKSLIKFDNCDKFEHYEYPGQYEKRDDGDAEVKLRMEEEEAGHDIVSGESYCRSFSPGYKFKLSKHHSKGEETKWYFLTKVEHTASLGGGYQTGEQHEDQIYLNQFTCIPENLTYRPKRVTKKPEIFGVQSAVVTGPAGDEIYTDKYGRVKVQFPWDRVGKKNENSSCWVRVAQAHAGPKWGAMDIPRIGEEVLVTFIDGDPDRPVIIGSVYNAQNMPPWDLPALKNIYGMKSNSTLGGGGYNLFYMDDSKGKEKLCMHAQHNKHTKVLNDCSKEIDANHYELVGGTQKISIIGASHLKMSDKHVHQVIKDYDLTVGGAHNVDVKKDISVHAKSQGTSTDETYEVQAGSSITISATGTIVIDSTTQISLKCGGSFINISPSGIDIVAGTVNVNAGGSAAATPGIVIVTPEQPEEPPTQCKIE